jgi:plastocyanin
MMGLRVLAMAAALAATVTAAFAGELVVAVTGKDSAPVGDAVVSVRPEAADAAASLAPNVPDAAVIGQHDLTFNPFVTLIRRGGAVTFTNNDNTGHHVYSFSPVRQFQMVLKKGEKSAPVTFDMPGVAAVGCNIHDQMLAYVYVSDAPLGLITKPEGKADFADLPPGRYIVDVWHPNLKPGDETPSQTVAIGDGTARIAFSLPVSRPTPHNMRMRDY